jgi:phosphoadenosine phosphosulfate reductase
MSAGQTLDLDAVNHRFERATPEEILGWTWERFKPDVILTCSFQHDGVALAHMLQSLAPGVRVVFIDTGFHFPETIAYRDEIVRRFGLNLVELKPIVPRPEFAERYGLDLYARNPDLCCHINKVEPLRRYLPGVRAWINGRRRDQASSRQAIPVVEAYQDGLYKVNPLASWTSRDTFYYLERHGIPLHPLFEQGYASIGCAPCTRPVLPGEHEREGRWAGQAKTECGLHTFLDSK